MGDYFSLMTQELNILTVISIASLIDLVTKHLTIGARKAEQKEKLKLPYADFFFDRGSPASWVEPSILSEVLDSSSRLASQGWIIFVDLWPSCPSIPLRGSYHKVDITLGGVFLAYHHGCTNPCPIYVREKLLWLCGIPFLLGSGACARIWYSLETPHLRLHLLTKHHLQHLPPNLEGTNRALQDFFLGKFPFR